MGINCSPANAAPVAARGLNKNQTTGQTNKKMSKKTTTQCPDGDKPNDARQTWHDVVNYRSVDGAVTILTKASTARRHPQHGYKIVCIRLRPKKGTRIQKLQGSEELEILLTHKEVVQHLSALNAADPKSKYTWLDIPEKPAERKAYWDRVNRERFRKFNGGKK